MPAITEERRLRPSNVVSDNLSIPIERFIYKRGDGKDFAALYRFLQDPKRRICPSEEIGAVWCLASSLDIMPTYDLLPTYYYIGTLPVAALCSIEPGSLKVANHAWSRMMFHHYMQESMNRRSEQTEFLDMGRLTA
jgi:hypothetical protein